MKTHKSNFIAGIIEVILHHEVFVRTLPLTHNHRSRSRSDAVKQALGATLMHTFLEWTYITKHNKLSTVKLKRRKHTMRREI